MKLSIVTTLYNSSSTVEPFYRRAVAAAQELTDDFEIIMVDDGSPDNSLEIACNLADEDSRVRVIELSRNFGHHKALMTGLDHARGDLCFLIDSDLEEDPTILNEFFKKLEETQIDVVYGFQRERKGGACERVMGNIAYRLFDSMFPYPIPRNHITVRLMVRTYVDSLLQHREQQTVIGGLWVITGFKQIGVPVNKIARGRTSYSFRRRWLMLIDSIASFSEMPLVAIFYLGIIISGLSALVGVALIIHKLIFWGAIEGWVSVMLSVWFLGGLLIFCVGVIGIYISKIFIETKNRPYTIVRRIHQMAVADRVAVPNDPIKRTGTKDVRPTRSILQPHRE
jgi:putative glycosyltransferase